jgi:hypothetical protein
MVKLVGTGGNQVPTNSMLGNMAFQNKEGVTIDLLGIGAGTAAAPSLIPLGDPNTGIWFPAADTVAISTGGSERLRVTSAGDVGIGTASPSSKLEISGSSADVISYRITNTVNSLQYLAISMGGGTGFGVSGWANSGIIEAVATGAGSGTRGLYLGAYNGPVIIATGSGSRNERVRVDATGNVGIGTAAPAFKLEVTGTAFISTSLRTPQLNNNAGVIGIEGNTSAFPGLKRSATTLQVRLADDTADAPFSAATINATTIPVNTPAFSTSGFSLTGNNAFSLMDMAGQWNTTGNPSAIRLNIANIASGASALLMELGTTDLGIYTARFTVSKAGNVTLADGGNLAVGLSTGTKIGTSTSQKIGFWNVTPIVQPTTSVAAATFTANSGTAVNDASTFDGYTISKVVKALRNLGLLA